MLTRLSTGPLGIGARSILRRSPALKRAAHRLANRGDEAAYELRFHYAMLAGIRPGDTVWDIGANVGLYTAQFADWVGDTGSVVAFEPAPASVDQLVSAVADLTNVSIQGLALSNVDGTASFDVSRGGTSVQNQLSQSGGATVRTARADTLVGNGEISPPDVVKIDVEGFEPEVIDGFDQILSMHPRALYIEVHFGALAARGRRSYPRHLVRNLESRGFDLEWADPSHLVAIRRG